jgi:hypothetical protein
MTDLTTIATTLGREATAKARAFAETNPVAKKAKDAVYTAVGFGVLGTQKTAAAVKNAQVTFDTDNVNASVKSSVNDVTETVKRQAAWVDAQLNKTVKTIDEAVAPFEQKLPSVVRDFTAMARDFTAKFLNHDADPENSETAMPEESATTKAATKSPKK